MLSTLSGSIVQDSRAALRGFVRDRRFTLSALAAITLAVGGATAVFSVVDRSLFRSLPYHRSERLVSVGVVAPLISGQDWLFAGTYQEWRASQTALAAITSWMGVNDCDRGGDAPERLSCARVEATFLPTLGVVPVLGRNFTPEEDRPDTATVAILTFGLWRSRFGSDPGIVGKSIHLDGSTVRIIGVLPASFETPSLAPADLLVPQRMRQGVERQRLVSVIGRLHDGATVESAAAAIAPLFQRFLETAPPDFRKVTSIRLRVATLRDQQTRDYRLALWMLFGSVTAFVLIACANVANLLLARTSIRRQEFAIRAALGASRRRLVQQMFTESGLLAIAGGAGGCGLACCLLTVLVALAPDGTLRLSQAAIDLRILAFALALSLGAALLFGLAPALERLRVEALGGARAVGQRRSWMRQALITIQLSISLVLLSGAALLLTSLWRLQNAPLGFGRERIVTASFTLPRHRYADDIRQVNFFTQLEAQLAQLPGVLAAAITDSLPPGGDPRSVPFVAIGNPGGSVSEQGMGGLVKWRYITPGYFAALGIPIQRGRSFTDADRQPGGQALILSESLSRRLFGAQDPIGKQVSRTGQTVIGVVPDVRNAGLSKAGDPEFYRVRTTGPDMTYRNQRPPYGWRRAIAVVRSSFSDRVSAEALRSAIRNLDPAIFVELETMETQVDRFYARPRFQTTLLSIFAATGLVLAAIGLYGLISFLVAERTREIGVRMALGATPGNIVKLVVSDGARWIGAGVVVGTAAAAALSRLLAGLLYNVEAHDPRVLAGAIAVLAAVAILAAWLPSRRAARIDPMTALRHD